MKKAVGAVILIAVMFMGGLAQQVRAASGTITIDGTVTDKNGPLAGYKVVITCWTTSKVTFAGADTTTDASGYYSFHVLDTQCPIGSWVEVRADKDLDGSFISGARGVVSGHTVLNIKVGNFYEVPEFGWGSGTVLMAGIGVVLLWRIRFARREEV